MKQERADQSTQPQDIQRIKSCPNSMCTVIHMIAKLSIDNYEHIKYNYAKAKSLSFFKQSVEQSLK